MLELIAALAISCPVERGNVKNATDLSNGPAINITWPTHVFLMTRPKPPKYDPNAPRRLAVETTMFEMTAYVLAYHLEKDEDIHLVVADDLGDVDSPTMVAEIPAPHCAKRSPFYKDIDKARTNFIQIFGLPGRHKKTLSRPVMVKIRGLGYWDKPHGQTGGAPNGIEIHPVTGIEPKDGP